MSKYEQKDQILEINQLINQSDLLKIKINLSIRNKDLKDEEDRDANCSYINLRDEEDREVDGGD